MNNDIENMFAEHLAAEFTAEIDNQIIQDLMAIADDQHAKDVEKIKNRIDLRIALDMMATVDDLREL